MKVAIVGSRGLSSDLSDFIPKETTEIISGGAMGIDKCAEEYAKKNNIKLTVIRPDYKQFGRRAPLIRNLEIIDKADLVIAFWDTKSNGTRFVIEKCRERQKNIKIFTSEKKNIIKLKNGTLVSKEKLEEKIKADL